MVKFPSGPRSRNGAGAPPRVLGTPLETPRRTPPHHPAALGGRPPPLLPLPTTPRDARPRPRRPGHSHRRGLPHHHPRGPTRRSPAHQRAAPRGPPGPTAADGRHLTCGPPLPLPAPPVLRGVRAGPDGGMSTPQPRLLREG